MSEIDFEALGRCHHIREQIIDTLRKRDSAFDSIGYRYQRTQRFNVTVSEVNMLAMHKNFKEFEEANTELMILVNEFNHWAEKAGERKLDIIASR